MIYDTFMVAHELDMLECRLTELEDVPDLIHVAIEADTDHQGHPKPYHVTDNLDRFARWADRLRIVKAHSLPDSPDAWDREHAQREWTWLGTEDAAPDDIILHGDLDEIPTTTFVRNVRPRGIVAALMDFYCFAVDWKHPQQWPGTVATRMKDIRTFTALRDARLTTPVMVPRSGWHFTWVGSHDYRTHDKTQMFCHPEVMTWAAEPIGNDDLWANGYHVDGARLEAVEVDRTWPRWIAEGNAPPSWYRPRDIERRDLTINAGAIVKPKLHESA